MLDGGGTLYFLASFHAIIAADIRILLVSSCPIYTPNPEKMMSSNNPQPEKLIQGIRIGVTEANIRYAGRDDLTIFELPEGTTTAATFTQNRFAAAPVIVAKKHLQTHTPRYLLINSGNANAGTGQQGLDDALSSCALLAQEASCSAAEVLPFSTGVIGEYLPMDKLASGISQVMSSLSEDGWGQAARAILTTDTTSKIVTHEFTFNAQTCRITGIAKGSGMIHPNMATMLAFISTDAALTQPLLQKALDIAVSKSFNCITVDGDTSTNDACVVSATGQGALCINENDMALEAFAAKLTRVCKQLAELIIRDAEGATKLARIRIEGGRTQEECRTMGFTVALSPLVKTALYGQDANWGRILAAVGRAPVDDFDLARIDIYLDEICIVRNGEREEYYVEADGARVMQRPEITIRINLNLGDETAEILTSDLSHEYVRINADYRT